MPSDPIIAALKRAEMEMRQWVEKMNQRRARPWQLSRRINDDGTARHIKRQANRSKKEWKF